MWHRILTLIIKELQQLLRSPQSRRLLIMPLLLQLMIFPFATTLEVTNSTLAIYNEDSGEASAELIQRLAGAHPFPHIKMVHDDAALQHVIDDQQASLAIRIPRDFSRRMAAREPVRLQALLDGRRSNSAQISYSYALQAVQQFSAERSLHPAPAALVIRNAYNPNLEYKWFVLPSLVAIIATVGCLMVTALSVSREREEGTFDQLMVTPLTPAYVMLGKAVPGILVGLAQGSIIAAAACWFYGVPLTGPLWLLWLSMFCYAFSLVGVGLFISALCATQQQAFLGVFCFLVPSIVLSGYIAPVENMPLFLRMVSMINPLTHFIDASKGIFLKHYGFLDAWRSIWPLLVIAVVTLGIAYTMFRRRSTS